MIEYREQENQENQNETQKPQKTAKVEDWGLADWLVNVQKLVQEGYVFDLDSNTNYPMVFGSMYTAIMVLGEEGKQVTKDTLSEHYMAGYKEGREFGLSQVARVEDGAKEVGIDPVKSEVKPVIVVNAPKPEYDTIVADDTGPVITEMKPLDITTVNNDIYGTKEVKPRKTK